MKKYSFFFLLLLTFSLFSCKQEKVNKEVTTDLVNIPSSASEDENENKDLPAMKFEEDAHDFGKITQGEKVSHAFKFKNDGKADLIISSAQGSCGCTVPHYSKKPIPPGEEGVVDVVFDSDGKEGNVKKTVTVVTNSIPNTKVLTISTEIIVPNTDKKETENQ